MRPDIIAGTCIIEQIHIWSCGLWWTKFEVTGYLVLVERRRIPTRIAATSELSNQRTHIPHYESSKWTLVEATHKAGGGRDVRHRSDQELDVSKEMQVIGRCMCRSTSGSLI